MTIEEFWKESRLHGEYDAWSFGENSDLLALLVRDGIKRATSSCFDLYEIEKEELPNTNTYSIILDSKNQPVCIIKNFKVSVIPFKDVTEDMAFAEGEGNRTLKYWKEQHEAFFKKELKEFNKEFSENMKIVFEEFEVVYRP